MSEQILRAWKHVRGEGSDIRIYWNNIKLGEITDERLARILKATFANPVCLSYEPTMRNGKLVLQIYGHDVPDDFKQMLEAMRQ